jgi:hypothetical protein
VVSFLAAGAFTQNAGSGNVATMGLPAGHASGNLLLALISEADNVRGTMTAYTEALWLTNGSNHGLIALWKIDGGSESAPTYTHAAGNGAGGFVLALTGARATNPIVTIGVAANGSATGATDTCTAPELSPIYRNSAVLAICGEAGSATGGTSGNNYAWTAGVAPPLVEVCDNLAFNGSREAGIGAAWGQPTERATNSRTVALSGLDTGAHTTITLLIEIADANPLLQEPYPQVLPHPPFLGG